MINKTKVIKDAQKFIAKAQWDKAIAEYDKIVKESPGDANTHNTIGDLYLKKNDPDNAIESYKKAAEIFNRSGFTLKAIALYKKVLNIKPDQVDVFILLGKLNAERGLIGNANESYLAAAAYFSRQGQRIKAIEIYKTLCDLNPENLSLAQTLADLYLSEGLDREAVSKFIELAEKKAANNEISEAEDLLAKAAPRGSDRFDFMRVSAFIDFKLNRLPEAAAKLEEARRADPSDLRITSLLNEVYQRSGRYEESQELVDLLLAGDPENIELKKQLITIHVKAGDYISAWKEYSFITDRYISEDRLQEAESAIREFLAHSPDSIDARHALAGVYMKSGNEQALDAVYMEMAGIYAAAGETSKAVNIYRKLLEKNPGNEELKAALSAVTAKSYGAPPQPTTEDIKEEPPLSELHLEPEPPPPAIEEVPSAEEISPKIELEEELDLADASAPEEGLPETDAGAVYELSEDIAGFEPARLDELSGMETGEGQVDAGSVPGTSEGLVEEETGIPDMEWGAEDIDFGEFSPAAEEEAPLPSGVEASQPEPGAAPAPPSVEEAAHHFEERPLTFEEQLSEVDIFIKYDLANKAQEALMDMEQKYPYNTEVKKKFIELYKSLGDVDGFVGASVDLAEVYVSQDKIPAAVEALKKALAIDRGNVHVEALLQKLAPGERPDISRPSTPASVSMPGAQKKAAGPTTPQPTPDYSEDVAEADFYAQQGLIDEARLIYQRILSINPADEQVAARLKALDEPKAAPASVPDAVAAAYDAIPEESIPPAAMPEETTAPAAVPEEAPATVHAAPTAADTLDDELDAAFSDMGFGDEEPAETGTETVYAEPPELPAQPSGHEAYDESEFFDLAAELNEELGEEEITMPGRAEETFEDKNLEAVFQEFKRGVEEQLNKEDFETHYNLGIAYKEMGMLDEALSEFALASKDAARQLACASMMGLCYMEKGDYAMAIERMRDGLNVPGCQQEEYLGLKYDLAAAYEANGDLVMAKSFLDEIVLEEPSFRDALERREKIGRAVAELGLAAMPKEPEKKGETAKGKRSRVSYL